jgi:hypothetical protein
MDQAGGNWLSPWKAEWRRFARRAPGRRFRARYDRRRAGRHGRSWWWQLLNIAAGILCLLIGLVLTVMPGPAVVCFVIAGVLLGNESRSVARFLDWIDVRGTPLVRRWGRRWHRVPRRWRRVAEIVAVSGGVVSLVCGWWLLR